MEHIERAHPLGVSLREIVVYGHHMDTLARKGIEEHRQCCHQGLTLTCRHLGNLSLMEGDTADELHVIVNHIPGYLVASRNPVVVIYGIVAVDGHKVVVDAQVTVELGSLYDNLAVLSEASGS